MEFCWEKQTGLSNASLDLMPFTMIPREQARIEKTHLILYVHFAGKTIK